MKSCLRDIRGIIAISVIAILMTQIFLASITIAPTYGAAYKDVGYIIIVFEKNGVKKVTGKKGHEDAYERVKRRGEWYIDVPQCKYVRIVNDLDRSITVTVTFKGKDYPKGTIPKDGQKDLHVGTNASDPNTLPHQSLKCTRYIKYDPPEGVTLESVECFTEGAPCACFREIEAVGGIAFPVDKLALIAPYIALAVALIAVTLSAVSAKKRWLVPKL